MNPMKKTTLCLVSILLSFAALIGCSSAPENTTPDYTVQQILSAIQEAYGEDYLPNMDLDEETLKTTFGLNMDEIEEVVGQMPMIGFHPDRVVVVKAKSGQGESVEATLNAARQTLIDEGMWYPANLAKVNASKVVRHGDYVCFLMVGAPDDTSEDEASAAEFAEAEVNKAVEAFNALFES